MNDACSLCLAVETVCYRAYTISIARTYLHRRKVTVCVSFLPTSWNCHRARRKSVPHFRVYTQENLWALCFASAPTSPTPMFV